MSPKSFNKILQEFRKYENDLPISSMLCFMEILESPGLTVSQAVNGLDLSKQSASRALKNLTHRARPGKDGIDVVRAEPLPEDYRVSQHFLNERGVELEKRIRQILSD
ncbi:MarR family transcriptional regulator [Marinobacter sp. F3R08]|uniref:MarR family transcriptional regulator n=1 Tax=Marinobacter sp. F3R08 TaxID=2841559 RepID=UPI001C08DE16|nr:helix-turn-helix domain-containing protein [Marinobacter sp. F3R08]MBU2952192.1 hypothetical protein [Marinobacter sp. F3R08]